MPHNLTKFCEMYKILRNALKTMRNVRIFFLQNEIKNEIWAFLARNTKRNLVLFKRNTGQGQPWRRPSARYRPPFCDS